MDRITTHNILVNSVHSFGARTLPDAMQAQARMMVHNHQYHHVHIVGIQLVPSFHPIMLCISACFSYKNEEKLNV